MPKVQIPPPYRGPTGGLECVEVGADSVLACIDAVEARYPGFRELVVAPDGTAQSFVKLFVNGEAIAADALDTPVAPGDEVAVLAAIGGGA